jgi:hypothetical protein
MTSTRLKPSTAAPISTLEKITHNTSRATIKTTKFKPRSDRDFLHKEEGEWEDDRKGMMMSSAIFDFGCDGKRERRPLGVWVEKEKKKKKKLTGIKII